MPEPYAPALRRPGAQSGPAAHSGSAAYSGPGAHSGSAAYSGPGAHSGSAAPKPYAPDELRALDRAHVWHPYGPMPGRQEPLIVESATGVRLRLAEPVEGQRELVDGMSSWWSAVHGYNHPVLNEAARGQLDRMSHVMFGGLTHEPAVRLATRLVEITPEPLQHVFLADSGSVSVEVAVKMCLQYWRSAGRPAKRRLLTWRGGYHGDTWQPMSVCDPEGGMHELWSGSLPRQVFADAPPDGFDAEPDSGYVAHLRELIAAHAHELAAVIVEPVVQGAGGMRFHSPPICGCCARHCDEHDVLLVLDEIATGFGRTGKLFAAGHAGISPDVMCVGKALTGGYLTMAATLCTTRVAEGISSGKFRCWRTGRRSWAIRWPHRWPRPRWTCCWGRTGGRGGADRRGLRSGLAPAADLAGVVDVRGSSGRSGSSSSTTRWTWRRRPVRPCARAYGCGRSAISSTRCRRT